MTPYEDFKALFLSGFESFRALKITLFERSGVLKVDNFMALFLSVSEYCHNPTNKTKQNNFGCYYGIIIGKNPPHHRSGCDYNLSNFQAT